MKNRLGIVRIAKDVYENNWDIVALIFKDFKPYHMEYSLHENKIYRFYGFSEKFDPVEEGSVIPFYDVICTREEKDGSFSHRFEKK